jgi:UDP:flavonoid glycosyltransferase YjiC (YdhE family)
MLLLPHGADQFENARACADRGAATVLMPNELTPTSVAAAVTSLLADPAPRAAGMRLARDIADMPTPADVVEALV